MGKIKRATHQQNKAVSLDYDFIRAQSADGCYYCLTDQQVTILRTMLEYVGWRTRWFSLVDTPIDTDWIAALEAELGSRLVTDECFSINEKLDAIIASLNGIKTVTDATAVAVEAAAAETTLIFGELTTIVEPSIAGLAATLAGISLQVAGVQGSANEIDEDVDDMELALADLKGNVTNIYNTINIGSNNTNVIFTFGASTLDSTTTEFYARYNALCKTVNQWILVRLRAVITALGGAPTDLGTLDLQIDTSFRSVYLQMTTGSGYAYSAATIFTASQDSSAVDDVACALLTALMPLEQTFDNFYNTVLAYTPPAYPDNRYIIQTALIQALDNLDSYTPFTQMLTVAYVSARAANPTGYVCSYCNPNLASIDVDFTKGQKFPFQVYFGISAANLGLETEITFSQPDGHDVHRTRIELEFSAPVTISSITVGYHWTTDSEGTPGCNFPHIFHQAQFASGGVCPDRLADGVSYDHNFTATNDGEVHTGILFTGATYVNPCRLTILVDDCQRSYLTEIHIH